MKHTLHGCDEENCFICTGGLASCNVCGGAEGDLPSDCPGVKMTFPQSHAVMSETMDYRNGKWWHAEDKRARRQSVIFKWGTKAFGADQMTSIPQRAARFLEEAIELAQACDLDKAMAHKLIDYIYDRPAGERRQELGGVGVTVMALAEALGESADECEAAEVARVLSKPTSHFTQRNQAKNDAGFYALGDKP